MSRPLRIQFEGAHYHVMNRGNARRPIFQADDDRGLFLEGLKEAAQSHRVVILAYCLMDNHYHARKEEARMTYPRSGENWVSLAAGQPALITTGSKKD